MESAVRGKWTMSEAAHMLSEPQQGLIYLCKKDVTQLGLQDAEGQQDSRRFWAGDLVFDVALRLRAF